MSTNTVGASGWFDRYRRGGTKSDRWLSGVDKFAGWARVMADTTTKHKSTSPGRFDNRASSPIRPSYQGIWLIRTAKPRLRCRAVVAHRGTKMEVSGGSSRQRQAMKRGVWSRHLVLVKNWVNLWVNASLGCVGHSELVGGRLEDHPRSGDPERHRESTGKGTRV